MIIKRVLGHTGLMVSELGFGTWPIAGDSYGITDDRESRHALQLALDEGVNFIDTADVYGKGHSEELIGQCIQGRRDQVVLATKAGWDFYQGLIRRNFDPEYLEFALDSSLKRLKTDYIDLFQLHNPPLSLSENEKVFIKLGELKRKGKLRSYGVSVHGPDEACDWIQRTDVETVQIAFNLLDQRPIAEFFDFAVQKKIGIIAREPLACGMLTGKYKADVTFPKNDHRRRWPVEKLQGDLEKIQKIKALIPQGISLIKCALDFVTSFQEVSVVIPGMKNVLQVKESLESVRQNVLTKECINQLIDLYEEDEIFSKGIYRN